MNNKAAYWPDEKLTKTNVQYILDMDGALLVFENVPARVNRVTGEQLFASAIIRHIQQIAMSARTLSHTTEASVYDWNQGDWQHL